MKRIIYSIVLIMVTLVSQAQIWLPAQGIENKIVRSIVAVGSDTLMAGVDDSGVYISIDKGAHWSPFALNGEYIYSLMKIDNRILAGTANNDIFISDKPYNQWVNKQIANLTFNNLSEINGLIFGCTAGSTGPGGLYASSDKGDSWSVYISNPPSVYLDVDANDDGRFFAATPFGAFYSDNQSPWIQTMDFGGTIRSVNYIGSDSLIYGTDFGIYLSTDNGVSGSYLSGIDPGTIYIFDNYYYAAILGNGLLRTSQLGAEWEYLNIDKFVHSLLSYDDILYAGTDEGLYYLGDLVSVSEKIDDSKLSVSPNPVKDYLLINSATEKDWTLNIYELSGKLIITSFNEQFVDVSSLSPGVYFYQAISVNGTFSGKFLKN